MNLQSLLMKRGESAKDFVDRIPKELKKLNLTREQSELLVGVLNHADGMSYEKKIEMLQAMFSIQQKNFPILGKIKGR